MEIKFNEQCEALFKEVAEEYGISAGRLKEYYCGVLYSNFYDDVHDIARENEGDLR